MVIVIDQDVKRTLSLRKKDVITIDYGILSSCWSIMPQVYISPKSPEDSKNYSKHQVDKFTVFINKDLNLEEEVRVKYPERPSDLSREEFEIVGATLPKN